MSLVNWACRWRRWVRGERGSAALSTAICVPVIFALIGLTVASGRIVLAKGAAEAAARTAARTASLERAPGEAEAGARKAAEASLRDSGVRCASLSVTVNAAGLEAPVGQAATVEATVICGARMDDVALPGLPGTKNLEATMTSVVDRYRGRSG